MNQTFEHIITALGWTLLHSLWQGLIVGLLFVVSRAVLSSANPIVRHNNALIWLLLLIVLPVFTFAGLLVAAPGSSVAASAILPAAPLAAMAVGAGEQPAALAVLGALWLSGVLVLSLKMARDWRHLNRLTRVDADTLPHLEATLVALSAALNVQLKVRLVEAMHASVPMVVGVLKPMIVIPSSALLGLSPRELELIIAHELGHLKRNDHLINYVLIAAETLLFFHPVVYTLTRTIRHERELCCDDLVIETFHDRVCYAHALSKLEALRTTTVAPSLQLAAADGPLVTRISRMVKQRAHRSWGFMPLILLPLVAAMFTVVVFHQAHLSSTDSISREVRSVMDTFSDSIGSAKRVRASALEPVRLSDYARRRVAASSVSKITDALTRDDSAGSLNRVERGVVNGMFSGVASGSVSGGPVKHDSVGTDERGFRHESSKATAARQADVSAPIGLSTDAIAETSGGERGQVASARNSEPATESSANSLSRVKVAAWSERENSRESQANTLRPAGASSGRDQIDDGASRIAYDMTAMVQPIEALGGFGGERLPANLSFAPSGSGTSGLSSRQSPSGLSAPFGINGPSDVNTTDEVLSGGDLIYSVTPKYPDRARSRGLVGRVVVSIKVSTDGSVDQVLFVNSDSRPMFQRAVKRAVSRWKFEPLLRNGEVVEQTVEQSFNFTLQPYSASQRGSACRDARRAECRVST